MPRARFVALILLAVALAACGSGPLQKRVRSTFGAGGWQESDFRRPLVVHPFHASKNLAEAATVIGEPSSFTVAKGDTLHDVARYAGLGFHEIATAHPQVDEWTPEPGKRLELPTFWVLPNTPHRGLVVNVPEMRLYYFPEEGPGAGGVITHAIGIGRDDWRTPFGKFRVTERTENPTWVIPESIRKERIAEKGWSEKSIAGGDPTNPLGLYRLRLSLPLYSIHGTDQPWAVGRKTSHGCIRLYPEDIEQLFPLVPVGTPGAFVDEPVKIGARGGEIFVEVHPPIYGRRVSYARKAQALLRAQGWEKHVDRQALAEALERKSGVPTRISRAERASL
jgi:L,D-transpeptidase ErfK/SrfK